MKKQDRTVRIMVRWVKGEIKTDQADRELEVAGVKLPKIGENKNGQQNESIAR